MSIVQCQLCPRGCVLEPGQSGDCRARKNIDGKLKSVVYGFLAAANVDPIEKKPLFHFLPGTKIFSVATVGCNMHCLNCQNWEISQANPEDIEASQCPPEMLVKLTEEHKCPSIAYTYTDPVVFYEYAYDSSVLAREKKIRNVLVSAAYINPSPWKRLLKYTDAATIDLKAINDEFYRKVCFTTLKPVLDALVICKESGNWLEVSNLLIPGMNDSKDDITKLVRWIRDNLGRSTPLHFLGFIPRYKMKNLPPTPSATLETARKIAIDEGVEYVYIGNVLSEQGQNTYCPSCKKMLIERKGNMIIQNYLKDGECGCGKEIAGVWK